MAVKEKENEKVEVEGGKALTNTIKDNGGGKKDDGDKGKGFSRFVSSVGDALVGVVDSAENKMEEIYNDPKSRRTFLQGLNTIIESSGYTPITQAKSPVGKIAVGQKKGFIEDLAIRQKERAMDIETLKAMKKEKRVADPKDKVIAELFKEYNKKYNQDKAANISTERTYNELLKLKDYTPTGLLENFVFPIEEIAQSLGKGDIITKIRTGFSENPDYVPDQETILEFKSIVDSGSSNRILGKAKELYPVSNVDLQLLLKGAGSLSTNPNALKVLLSAEQALGLINEDAYTYASKLAYPGEGITGSVSFQAEGADAAAKALSVKFEKEVKDETLKKLYGDTEKTPFRIIQAKLFQDLQADKSIPEISAFDKFIGAEAEKTNITNDMIKKYQKKKKN